MPTHPVLTTATVTAAVLAFAAPAAQAAGGWGRAIDLGPVETATSTREAVLAAGAGGDLSVLVTTRGRSRSDTALSLRRTRADGTLGRPLLLARSSRTLVAGPLAVDRSGRSTAVWTLNDARPVGEGTTATRLHAVRVGPDTRGRTLPVIDLTEGRRPTMAPVFVPGLPGPVLAWFGAYAAGEVLTARWSGAREPELATQTLPSTTFGRAVFAGTPSGWTLAASVAIGGVRVATSADGARSFLPGTSIPGSRTPVAGPSVATDRRGTALIGWVEDGDGFEGDRMRVSTLARGGAPSAALTLATGAPTRPQVVADRAGGGFAGWLSLAAGGRAATLAVARVRAGGETQPVLRVRGVLPGRFALVPDGAGGATAIWLGRDHVLRARRLGAGGGTGRRVVLARGVLSGPRPRTAWDGFGVASAGGTAAVLVDQRGRMRLLVRR